VLIGLIDLMELSDFLLRPSKFIGDVVLLKAFNSKGDVLNILN
jgi:hypothetical protein